MIFTSIRLFISPFFGLGVDEAHYVLYGKYIDWSYYDHPPLTGWIQALFYHFIGTSERVFRLPAILIAAASSFALYLLLRRITGSTTILALAIIAVNSAFMIAALSLMFMPDGLLILFVLLVILAILKLEENPSLKQFVLLGLALGLAGLSKYTAVLLLPSILLFFIWQKRWDILFHPYVPVTVVVALILILPVIYWNAVNEWVSLNYQFDHVLGKRVFGWQNFGVSIFAQFAAYSPFLFALAFYGFLRALTDRRKVVRLFVSVGVINLIFFLYSSFFSYNLPHWSLTFYFLFIPMGVYYALISGKKYLQNFCRWSVLITFMLTLFVYGELIFKLIPFPHPNHPLKDIYGWDQIMEKANILLKKNENRKKALAVHHWVLGSRSNFYNEKFDNRVFVVDKRNDQFDLWSDENLLGFDLLFINTYSFNKDINKIANCTSVQQAGKMEIKINGHPVNSVDFIWCKCFEGLK